MVKDWRPSLPTKTFTPNTTKVRYYWKNIETDKQDSIGYYRGILLLHKIVGGTNLISNTLEKFCHDPDHLHQNTKTLVYLLRTLPTPR